MSSLLKGGYEAKTFGLSMERHDGGAEWQPKIL